MDFHTLVRPLLDKLHHVSRKPNGHGYRAACPLHDDQHPSLDIDAAPGGTPLLCCRVCGPERNGALLQAVGLTWGDLLGGPDRPRPVAAFDYRDGDGHLLFQSVRLEPGLDGRAKSYFLRRPDGHGGWINNAQGVPRVLYRRPELAATTDPVCIVEGEGKVDLLRRHGLTATCNPGGAGKWRPEYNAALTGRDILIFPDNDDPGHRHAEAVAGQLHGVARSVRMVALPGLPPKGDVKDWFAAGRTVCELIEAGDAAPPWGLPSADGRTPIADGKPCHRQAGDFRPVAVEDLRCEGATAWVWDGYLAPGEVTLLTALWKVGKTTFLAHLLRALRAGTVFCGREVRPGRVLYFSEECARQWVERRDRLGLGGGLQLVLRHFPVRPDLGRWQEFLRHLATWVRQDGIDLVVLDTLASLWPVVNENDAAEVGAALRPFQQLGGRTAVLLVHHHRKSGGSEATASRGSGALPGTVDTIIELRRPRGADRACARRVLTGYGRHSETPLELEVELTAGGYVVVEAASEEEPTQTDVKEEARRRTINQLLPDRPPGLTGAVIWEALPPELRPRRARFLEDLETGRTAGTWCRQGNGKRGDPFTYWRGRDERTDAVPVPAPSQEWKGAGTETETADSPEAVSVSVPVVLSPPDGRGTGTATFPAVLFPDLAAPRGPYER